MFISWEFSCSLRVLGEEGQGYLGSRWSLASSRGESKKACGALSAALRRTFVSGKLDPEKQMYRVGEVTFLRGFDVVEVGQRQLLRVDLEHCTGLPSQARAEVPLRVRRRGAFPVLTLHHPPAGPPVSKRTRSPALSVCLCSDATAFLSAAPPTIAKAYPSRTSVLRNSLQAWSLGLEYNPFGQSVSS